jgi:hypothetical protein
MLTSPPLRRAQRNAADDDADAPRITLAAKLIMLRKSDRSGFTLNAEMRVWNTNNPTGFAKENMSAKGSDMPASMETASVLMYATVAPQPRPSQSVRIPLKIIGG